MSKKSEKAARKAVVEAAQHMSGTGLSPGRSGNISMRWDDGMLITPSGKAYDDTDADDIVFVDGCGRVPAGQLKPSSEWRFHHAVYEARPDRHAIVHTHSMYATILACVKQPIPAFHYMVAIAGGKDIPCVPYATFGTNELASYVAGGLSSRDACLMARHGQIAIGETLGRALELAFEVENLAQQYYKILQLGPANLRPEILTDEQMSEMVEKFKQYGQKGQG